MSVENILVGLPGVRNKRNRNPLLRNQKFGARLREEIYNDIRRTALLHSMSLVQPLS